MSQQRTSAVRRVRPNMLGVQFTTFDWRPGSWAGTSVLIDLFPNYPAGPLNLTGFTLDGVPRMWDNNTLQFATGAAIVGNQLELTFDNPLDVGIVFYLDANDLAFRDPYGGFMRAGQYGSAGIPPTPQNAVALSVYDDSGRLGILQDDGAGRLYVSGVPLIQNTTTAEFADSVVVQGSNIFAAFPTGVSSGDSFIYTSSSLDFLGADGGFLDSFALSIP